VSPGASHRLSRPSIALALSTVKVGIFATRAYLAIIDNVAILRHGEPRLTQAAARRLLE
jgi:hypothetical protein